MQPVPRSCRNSSQKLPESLKRQLNAYALAATASGVGILGLASSAHAKVIYTPASQYIGGGTPVQIDLSHDGQFDFSFVADWAGCGSSQVSYASVRPVGKNAMYGYGKDAKLLLPGHRIGPGKRTKERFAPSNRLLCANFSEGHSGSWCGAPGDYVGLAFTISNRTHHGWARLIVDIYGENGILTGYAYETVPGKGLFAGQIGGTDDAVSRARQPRRSSGGGIGRHPA